MADVRNLLKNEQASRRISHPHLSYTRSGQLNCTVCDLFIKSASLWEGHLRSANHRKNAQRATQITPAINQTKKRKNDDSDDDSRKRSRAVSSGEESPSESKEQDIPADRPKKKVKSVTFAEEAIKKTDSEPQPVTQAPTADNQSAPATVASGIDEDEWAAFEREVAPLMQKQPGDGQYSATIVAAPVSAADIAEQKDAERRPTKDIEAEEEKEEEERRLEEELDVMEEMEERVRRLKQKRATLRNSTASTASRPKTLSETIEVASDATELDRKQVGPQEDSDEEDDDYDDFDDWSFR